MSRQKNFVIQKRIVGNLLCSLLDNNSHVILPPYLLDYYHEPYDDDGDDEVENYAVSSNDFDIQEFLCLIDVAVNRDFVEFWPQEGTLFVPVSK